MHLSYKKYTKLLFMISIVSLVGFNSELFSQNTPAKNKIPTIRIEAEKDNPNQNKEASGETRILYTKDFEMRASTVADVLEREASVRIRRFGGRGAYSSLSLRGSNPNQVNIFIDGIPITGASNAQFNVSDLNLDSFEKIEIHKSGSYPGSPIGGSINLITKKSNRKKSGGRVKVIAGSHKTFGLSAGAFGGKKIKYSVTARGETSDQKYKFINHNGTPLINPFDDFEDRRQNAWYKNYFSTLNISTKIKDTSYFFLHDSALRHHGLPGAIPAQTKKIKRKNFRNTSGLGLDSKGLFLENIRLKSRIYYTDIKNSHFDPEQEFSINQPNRQTRQNQYGVHVEPIIYLFDHYQTLKLYFATEREQFRSDKRNKDDMLLQRTPTRFRNHHTARISDEFLFWDDRMQITPAAQYQKYVDHFNEESRSLFQTNFQNDNKNTTQLSNYKLHSSLTFWKTKRFKASLIAGASNSNRVATFLELFGEKGSIIGNTDLKPERATTTEIGTRFKAKTKSFKASLAITGFHRSIKDMILLIPNSRFTLRPENIDNAEIRGAEIASKININKFIKIYMNYTWQKAINTSNVKSVKGKYLPLRPLHESTTGLSFYQDRWEIGAEAVYVGAVFRNRTNEATSYVDPRWTWNLFMHYALIQKFNPKDKSIKEELSLGLDIKNLQNKHYTDTTEFPLPGRTAYLTLNWKY